MRKIAANLGVGVSVMQRVTGDKTLEAYVSSA